MTETRDFTENPTRLVGTHQHSRGGICRGPTGPPRRTFGTDLRVNLADQLPEAFPVEHLVRGRLIRHAHRALPKALAEPATVPPTSKPIPYIDSLWHTHPPLRAEHRGGDHGDAVVLAVGLGDSETQCRKATAASTDTRTPQRRRDHPQLSQHGQLPVRHRRSPRPEIPHCGPSRRPGRRRHPHGGAGPSARTHQRQRG